MKSRAAPPNNQISRRVLACDECFQPAEATDSIQQDS